MTRCSHEQSDQTIGYNFYHIACRTNGKMLNILNQSMRSILFIKRNIEGAYEINHECKVSM